MLNLKCNLRTWPSSDPPAEVAAALPAAKAAASTPGRIDWAALKNACCRSLFLLLNYTSRILHSKRRCYNAVRILETWGSFGVLSCWCCCRRPIVPRIKWWGKLYIILLVDIRSKAIPNAGRCFQPRKMWLQRRVEKRGRL